MQELKNLLDVPGRTVVAGAPDGHDARVLAQLARKDRTLVYVARDEERMLRMRESLGFFAPDVPTLLFPAWDCLPYDRVSPHADVMSRRVETLAVLADGGSRSADFVLLTTVNALLQRVPPLEVFRSTRFAAKAGDRVDLDALTGFLARNGYSRTDTVMEPGEYAIRGGIVDIFPPGIEEPLRLDLFGDELEGIRTFDPLTQRTTEKRDRFDLKPVSEVLLDDPAVQRFRAGYRAAFGAVAGKDPLYESVSAGRRHAGMEHWLPLFHEQLQTLLDYVPGAAVVLDAAAEEARDARLETIADHYAARKTLTDGDAGGPYRPLPPDQLYLTAGVWDALLLDRPTAAFSGFGPAEAGQGGKLVDAGGRVAADFSEVRAKPDANVYAAVAARVADQAQTGRRTLIAGYSAGSRDRLGHLLAEHGLSALAEVGDWREAAALPAGTVGLAVLELDRGFDSADLAVITEQDILGERLGRRPKRRKRAEQFLTEASQLTEGDLVVHIDHGIGRYEGLETLDVGGAPHDCLRVVYSGGDKLFVPVENIEVLSRFGSEEAGVQLDKLGGASWQARRARLKQRIREIADQLIAVAAQRQLKTGETVQPPEGLYDEFCARFPYPETEDQMRSIEEVLEDLGSGRPMDRLVCGDVGFGKTEVALRAAFVVAMSGLQVAVVVPTTLLARQHYRTFADRFAGLPIKVGQLSRMVTGQEAKQVKAGLADGTLDIVIGTHALLAKGITFRSLGLLVVDEEQHFGVSHKERLKQLKTDVHVLTMTATPIPRTLQMALSGVREMSLITTPPVDRLAVRTFVTPHDPLTIREAIVRERFRGGQTFYVCPRVKDLGEIADEVRKLVPDAKLAVAHGGLSATDLEAVMSGFYDRLYDVLISTNIVESGLDIATANTMIVHRADMFGLAQLYQLRGRIGRGKVRAYCYLSLPPKRQLTKTAEKRLQVMQALDTLGAGFSLASHDLDIRGAGNLLGEEQSGHIREVGIELYQQMLEEAIADARSGERTAAETASQWTPQISLGTPVLIPESYVAELSVRLGLYRRISGLEDRAEIDGFAAELIDRFGPLPREVENLLEIVAIKRLCRAAGVEKIDAGPKGAVVAFRNNSFANPLGLVDFLSRQMGTAKLRPDQRIVYQRAWDEPKARLKGATQLLESLAAIASAPAGEAPRKRAS